MRSAHVEVGEQFLGVSFSLLPCGSEGLTQVARLSSKHCFPLSLLASPGVCVCVYFLIDT